MSNTTAITDPSKNNMDGTIEVSALPPLTSIAGHLRVVKQSHQKARGIYVPSLLVDPVGSNIFIKLGWSPPPVQLAEWLDLRVFNRKLNGQSSDHGGRMPVIRKFEMEF